ncbi:MAG: ArsR family transcriptional regulator [Blastocatellia bacterium]|nr:ArsR family transcriptional regulator [Blastocatellia bacterium]
MLPSIMVVVAAITNILKETRSEILARLRTKKRMTVEEIASAVGVSKVSIRRHLDLLRRDGLVEFDVERHDRGRPGHVYYLTDKAEILFPTGYNTFALNVLRQVKTMFGEPAVARIFCEQADDLIASLKPRLEGLGFDERVKKLCSLVNERGYDITFRRLQDGSYLVKQRNCPMVAVAASYDQICNEELRLYRELLETDVFRECRIAAGSQSCDYRIFPPGKPGSLNILRLQIDRQLRDTEEL